MKIIPFVILMLLFSVIVHAEKIAVKAKDCGPLDRDNLGVVFYVLSNGKKQTYFTTGKADIICPKLMESKMVSGYEMGLCERNKPFSPEECTTIKEFVILDYKN